MHGNHLFTLNAYKRSTVSLEAAWCLGIICSVTSAAAYDCRKTDTVDKLQLGQVFLVRSCRELKKGMV